MAVSITYHEGAVQDVKRGTIWYREHSPRAAADFIDEIGRAAELIRKAPERWPKGKSGTRRFLLWRFPYTLIYSYKDSVVTIWAVAHGSRKPDYWAPRLK